MSVKELLLQRAQDFVQRHGLTLGGELGRGVHGIVFATKRQPKKDRSEVHSAIKVHEHEADYRRERDVYLRLQAHGVKTIHGCHVPQLLRYDDQVWIIEMTVVSRPFVLDFAGAFLDKAPDFSEEVIADWRVEKLEQFGDRWSEVERILGELESHGIHLIDVSPSNVAFKD
jgi:hypothetical protein